MLLLSGGVFSAEKHNHSNEGKPLYGGVVTEVKDIDYELVAKPDVLQLYVSNHGKSADVSKASAKVILLTGSDKQEIELKPVGDKFELKGNFQIAPGMKIVAQVRIGGGTSTARFTLK